MSILGTYSFQIVALGTVLLAIASSMVGGINVYKGQSLIGDALGHSTFAGVVIAFMLFLSRNSIILLLGAMIVSMLAYIVIQFGRKNTKIGLDANMAIVLSGFFGLGVTLKSYIQGHSSFRGGAQAGLDRYIFGQAAYLLKQDLYLILVAAIISLLIILIFYKEFKTYLFDREYAYMIGINVKLLERLLLFLTILLIGVGIKAVGAVLISSFLVMPTVSASQISKKFSVVLILSAIFGSISAFVGSFVSTAYKGISTGPSIILVSGLIFCVCALIRKVRG